MATRNMYIREKDMPKVKRLERLLEKQRLSLSEWFMRKVISEIEAAK